jgi:hypothetical protein
MQTSFLFPPAFVRYMDRNNLQLQDDALIQPIAGVGDVETMVEHWAE